MTTLPAQMLQQLKHEKKAIDETIAALERLSRQQAKTERAVGARVDSSRKTDLKQRKRSERAG